MQTVMRVVVAFLVGLILTYLAVVGGLFWYAGANNVVDRDGGMAMGIVFIIGPIVGILGGIAAAIASPLWLRRRDRARAAGTMPPAHSWPLPVRLTIAAGTSGVAVYLAVRFVLWLNAGMSFRSYWVALTVASAPLLLGLAAAALAAFLVVRGARRRAG